MCAALDSTFTVTYDKAPNTNNVFPKHGSSHNKKSSLGFEAGSVLNHYVNQNSTFQNNKRELSFLRLSQSLSIPPIQLTEDITSVNYEDCQNKDDCADRGTDYEIV